MGHKVPFEFLLPHITTRVKNIKTSETSKRATKAKEAANKAAVINLTGDTAADAAAAAALLNKRKAGEHTERQKIPDKKIKTGAATDAATSAVLAAAAAASSATTTATAAAGTKMIHANVVAHAGLVACKGLGVDKNGCWLNPRMDIKFGEPWPEDKPRGDDPRIDDLCQDSTICNVHGDAVREIEALLFTQMLDSCWAFKEWVSTQRICAMRSIACLRSP